MEKKEIKKLVSEMTLEEKAGMCSGVDFWHTKAVERLGIPAVMMSDGPYGLRKQEGEADHLGLNESIKTVCFPAGVSTASSFNRKLVRKLGETLGEECQAENIGVLLGPAMNIKRSPLCGRNFEYYSEDPYVSSQMASAYIKGLQSKHVGACPKHFYANNMEEKRQTASSELDERTAREIYLASFEETVKEAKPWSIMCSYNRINGTYAAENREALTEILRTEWGFDGFVVSDWGATNNRVSDLKAGLDLEMPSTGGITDSYIIEAVQNGTLDEADVNHTCERILDIVFRWQENRDASAVMDRDREHEIARKIAEECMVLLKNDGVLPLSETQKIAFIGKYAERPRYQGGGSSHINSYKVSSVLDTVKEYKNITYVQGFDDALDETDETLLTEARKAAEAADVAVIFAGLPDAYESEGYDRKHMKMPPNQDYLIEEVCKVQKNVVVVLHNGSPVEMPWISKVSAVLESYLGGEAVGEVQRDILFGKVNPSGKLAESFPIRLQDNPSYLSYHVKKGKVHYQEEVFVGYRYYDSKEMEVLFPFGHGLSYTAFKYSNLKLDRERMTDEETLNVAVDIKNTGKTAGKEIVQLYVSPADCDVIRPAKELKGFEKVSLEPGEQKTVRFALDKRAFAYWAADKSDWRVSEGIYGILIGASSRDIRETAGIYVEPAVKEKVIYTPESTFGEVVSNPKKAKILMEMFGGMAEEVKKITPEDGGNVAIGQELIRSMVMDMPMRSLFVAAEQGAEQLQQFLNVLNQDEEE